MSVMSKTGVFLCCLCMLLGISLSGLTVSAAGSTTYSVSDMQGHYKTQGRVYNDGTKLYPDFSASGIEFVADCEGDVYVNFEVNGSSTCYFTVIVDGVTQPRAFCKLTQTTSFKIASGLSAGTHRFEIYRQTEIGAKVAITGVTLNGTLGTAPAENALYIEYIGDSITAAYGNLANSSTSNSGTADYMDATQGYAYLTARNLDADYSLVAIQGIGALTGWQSYNMQKMYPLQRYPLNGTLTYDFAREADVVVLALGTNDANRYSATGYTLPQVKQGFKDMLALARSKNPNAKIVWIYNMMTGGVNDLITEVIDEAGGEAANYYSLSLPRSNSGGNGHPNATQQRTFATLLTSYIEELITPPTTTTTTTATTTTTKPTTITTTRPTTSTTTTRPTTLTTKKTTTTENRATTITTKKTTRKKTTTKRTTTKRTSAKKTTTTKVTTGRTTTVTTTARTNMTVTTTVKGNSTVTATTTQKSAFSDPLTITTTATVADHIDDVETGDTTAVLPDSGDESVPTEGAEAETITTALSDNGDESQPSEETLEGSTTEAEASTTTATEALSAGTEPENGNTEWIVITSALVIIAGGGTVLLIFFKKKK